MALDFKKSGLFLEESSLNYSDKKILSGTKNLPDSPI